MYEKTSCVHTRLLIHVHFLFGGYAWWGVAWNEMQENGFESAMIGVNSDVSEDDKVMSENGNLFDLTDKSHYFNPETTLDLSTPLFPEKVKLSWILEPFNPSPSEFQAIATYQAEKARLSEVIDEAAFFTPDGGKKYIAGVDKLKQELRERLGKERFKHYEYLFTSGSGYTTAWRMLNVNGFDEGRVQEMLDIAAEYNRLVHGKELNSQKKINGWTRPEDLEPLKESFRQRIVTLYGEQMLYDIFGLTGNILFDGLEFDTSTDLAAYRATGYREPWEDEAFKARLEEQYQISLTYGTNESPEQAAFAEKLEALANRERNFQLEFGQQVAETLAGDKGARPSSTMP